MRTTLTTVSVIGLLAAGAGTAVAKPDIPTARDDAALHAQAMRYQAEAAYYRDHENVASASKSAPAPVVHVTRVPLADGGFDWADAGIGAGLTAALLFSAAGAAALRRQHPAIR